MLKETMQKVNDECNIIHSQLGGNKFDVMIGAYRISYDLHEYGSQFSCKFKGSKKANILVIVYNRKADIYNMRFLKQKSSPTHEVIEIEKICNVYAEDLQKIFTEVTGLYTHL